MVKKGAKDGARAAKIANSVLEKCKATGGRDCEASAIRFALSAVNGPSPKR